jgi:hypothetical protein
MREQSESYCTLIQQTKNVFPACSRDWLISEGREVAADEADDVPPYVVAFVNLQTDTKGNQSHATCQIIAVTPAVSLAACREF